MKQKNNKSKTDKIQSEEINDSKANVETSKEAELDSLFKLDKEQLQKYVLALIQENEYLIAQNSELEERACAAEVKSGDVYGKLVAYKNDFERFKTRNKEVAEEAEERGRCAAIERIFPLLDTFDRAQASAEKSVIDALTPIARQFETVLKELSIMEIDVLNKPFNPQTANAVLEMSAENEQEKNTVCAIVSKGYIYKEKILRYPNVVVKV